MKEFIIVNCFLLFVFYSELHYHIIYKIEIKRYLYNNVVYKTLRHYQQVFQ